MEESIKKLETEFIKIKNLGYIKSVNNNTNGIGLTFESLLGKEAENFPLPDYLGIELKCKSANTNRPINLFGLTPEGKDFFEIKRIFNNYGYYYNNTKRFIGSVKANEKRHIGPDFQFSLKIDYQKEQILLEVYNSEDKLIDNTTFWQFSDIENALYRKVNYLALVKVSKKMIDGNDYYKYYKLNIFKLKDFQSFIKLIENEKIYVNFSIGTFRDGKKDGQIHDHGTYFSIFESSLYKLFEVVSTIH